MPRNHFPSIPWYNEGRIAQRYGCTQTHRPTNRQDLTHICSECQTEEPSREIGQNAGSPWAHRSPSAHPLKAVHIPRHKSSWPCYVLCRKVSVSLSLSIKFVRKLTNLTP